MWRTNNKKKLWHGKNKENIIKNQTQILDIYLKLKTYF